MVNGKYDKFTWRKAWYDYADTITNKRQCLAFNRAIANYGLEGIEPRGLEGDALRYFDNHVRPDLDRQHSKPSKRKLANEQ